MIIGVTGGFGTGKTIVAKMLKNLGAEVIDCDKIVHSLIDYDTRLELRKFVFDRKVYLDRLNRIIHPVIIKIIKERIKKLRKKVTVIDAPLLIETGLDKICDRVICVKTKKSIQIQRAMKSSKLKRDDVIKRIRFQLPLKEKIKRADFVIDNNKTLSQTKKQVERIWKEIYFQKS